MMSDMDVKELKLDPDTYCIFGLHLILEFVFYSNGGCENVLIAIRPSLAYPT